MSKVVYLLGAGASYGKRNDTITESGVSCNILNFGILYNRIMCIFANEIKMKQNQIVIIHYETNY